MSLIKHNIFISRLPVVIRITAPKFHYVSSPRVENKNNKHSKKNQSMIFDDDQALRDNDRVDGKFWSGDPGNLASDADEFELVNEITSHQMVFEKENKDMGKVVE
ncbi:uncharacterized protein VTP21DRAFT_2745 [Calcarisporiella thermophila]|uniref:uncharacterized protein n=1 Tax=Calcarisporiella thermophila TaxID=911321 RepID=UPI003744515E